MAKYLAMRVSMGKLELDAVVAKYPLLETEIRNICRDTYGMDVAAA